MLYLRLIWGSPMASSAVLTPDAASPVAYRMQTVHLVAAFQIVCQRCCLLLGPPEQHAAYLPLPRQLSRQPACWRTFDISLQTADL